MSQVIEYYFVPVSPWSYLGHQRLQDIARAAGAGIEVLPFDLGGKVFPISGGLPLGRRAPQRQAYRLLELRRFSALLQMPLIVEPKYFPVSGDDASRLIIAVQRRDGNDAALRLAGAALRAVWVDERDLGAAATLEALLAEQALPACRIDDARAPEVQQAFEANTERAIRAGVFGAPSYVIDGELFWGQDRLDFVARRLARR